VPVQPAPPSGDTSSSHAPATPPPAPAPSQGSPAGADGAGRGSAGQAQRLRDRQERRAAARRAKAREAAARKAAAGEAAARESAAVSTRRAPPSSVVRVDALLPSAQPDDDSHTELLLAAGILLALVMVSGSLLSVATRTMKGGKVS